MNMKPYTTAVTLFTLAAALLAAPASAEKKEPEARVPQSVSKAGTTAAPWVFAQYERRRATCTLDERQHPAGATACLKGEQMLCSPQGSWIKTGKAC
jgi:hypothetical protein